MAPTVINSLTFSLPALAASIARTTTLKPAPPTMLHIWGQVALLEVQWLIDNSSDFSLSPHIHSLADTERTGFAGKVGAGVADLLLNSLGYSWRDNAASVASKRTAHPDFIYDSGAASGHGVVIAEAHGSFRKSTSNTSISKKGCEKYDKQVSPFLGRPTKHGNILHGYSIAFGAKPKVKGAFLHVSETQTPTSTKATPAAPSSLPPSSSPATPLSLATYRSNFSLIGAMAVSFWIDWISGIAERPDDELGQIFLRVAYDGDIYLVSPFAPSSSLMYHDYLEYHESIDYHYHLRGFPRKFGISLFAIREKNAQDFLNQLTKIIRNGKENMPDTIDLPRANPIGFGLSESDEMNSVKPRDYYYAQFPDGLALLGTPPPRRIAGMTSWNPTEGIQEM
jgi:hypothetical protein